MIIFLVFLFVWGFLLVLFVVFGVGGGGGGGGGQLIIILVLDLVLRKSSIS